MQPVLITHDHPATAGYLSSRDRLAAAGMLLSGLTRDISDDLIQLSPAEAIGVLEHIGDIERRFARLRTAVAYQQRDASEDASENTPAGPAAASGVNSFGWPCPGCTPAAGQP